MKKYVAGFLAGALFTLAGAAFADDIQSLIGKKIQGEAVVELNGQALDTAIIVDGKSYAPVRVIGEAAGYDVSMQNKKIILDEKTSSSPTVTIPGKGQNVEEQTAKLNDRIKNVKEVISGIDIKINAIKEIMAAPEYVERDESSLLKFYEDSKNREQSLLSELESQLATLK
ncbi:hypothetical protein MKZ12_07325 [Paenibacillus sp. FSL R5-0713]|uniref:hypothetical protein n=1 Tax=Paenibacillus sp. FSL R5-0713 TaxID=2921655 RepID=UPI0030D91E3B